MTGIIGAMDIEVNGLISEMENPVTETISTMRFTSGKIGGHDVVVAKCGVGKVNAAVCAQTMILRYHPDRIINTGIAGSTSAKTHIGSVVIADRAVQHDMNTEVIGDADVATDVPTGRQIDLTHDITLPARGTLILDF